MKWTLPHLVLLFLFGAIGGSLGDGFHLLSGTTDYPQEIFGFYLWRMPFWVPLEFGLAGLAIALSHVQMDSWLKVDFARPGARSLTRVFLGILAFLSIYALSGFFPLKSGGTLNFLLASAAITVWAGLDRSWQGILLGVLTAFLGVSVEISLVHLGAFAYLAPKNNFYGVPSWLPWLYLSASVAVGNLGRFLKYGSRS